MSVVLCGFWTVAREQNESKRDYFKYAKEHNTIIIIFVAVKCRTLHNRPHVKPLNTYRLLLQGRSQYEANRGTCLSHLRFDPGSVLFQRSHHKDPE